MGPRPILLIKVPINISTMLNFNGPNFGPNLDVVTCEQAFKVVNFNYTCYTGVKWSFIPCLGSHHQFWYFLNRVMFVHSNSKP